MNRRQRFWRWIGSQLAGPEVQLTPLPEMDYTLPALRTSVGLLQAQIALSRATLENVSVEALAVIAIDLAVVQALVAFPVVPLRPVVLGAVGSGLLALATVSGLSV